MLKGSLHLTLLMGPVIPVPVPQLVVDALIEVSVTNAVGSASGFELKFGLSNDDSVLTHLMLLLAQVGPVLRTILIVVVKGMPEVVIDGVVTQHQVTPDVQSGTSMLTLTGSDLTAVLDFVDFTGIPYPAISAPRGPCCADNRKICDVRPYSRGNPAHHVRGAQSPQPDPIASRKGSGVHQPVGRTGGIYLFH